MFGFISKKKLGNYLMKVRQDNRKEKLGAKYPPEDKGQEETNLYAQAYEDGTDNTINAIIGKFKI